MKINHYISSLLYFLFLNLSSFLQSAPADNWFAYTGNILSNNTTPIQLATGTGTALDSISLNLFPDYVPVALALTPDGNTAYIVKNGNGANNDGNVIVMNLLTNNLITVIPFPAESAPSSIAITPDGSKAYVVNYNSGQLVAIDTSTYEIIQTIQIPSGDIPGGSNPLDLAISPDGSTAYVICANFFQVLPINLVNGEIESPFPVGMGANAIAITPNGQKAYVVNNLDNSLTIINLTTRQTSTLSGLSAGPIDIAINSKGTRAYVISSDLFDINNNGFFTVIDLNSDSIIGAPVLEGTNNNPTSLAVSPDGLTAYVTNAGNSLTTSPNIPTTFAPNLTNSIDNSINFIPSINNSNTTVTPVNISTDIPVMMDVISIAEVKGLSPSSIAITPDQAPTASFTAHVDSSTLVVSFDASSSFSPVGEIVSYQWNFGDGRQVNNSSSTVSHQYEADGEYLVTLTVINSAGTSTFQLFTGHTMSNNGGPSATTNQLISLSNFIPPSTLFPPLHVKGLQRSNKFAVQSDYINIIKWKAPKQGTIPVAYRIYKDAQLTQLIATIQADISLKFSEHHCYKKHPYHYFIVSVDSIGNQSEAAQVTIKSKRN